jgi:hypothetical protein
LTLAALKVLETSDIVGQLKAELKKMAALQKKVCPKWFQLIESSFSLRDVFEACFFLSINY